MTTTQREELENLIVAVLREAPKPLTIPQLHEKLEEHLADKFSIDTFDVRDAVWRLIARQQAQFTPRRYVKSG
jgi:hypothetical protein